MLEQCCVIYFVFPSSHSLKKLVRKCCGEFGQINGGYLVSCVFNWISESFEIEDTCIEFVINNLSPQGNNVKIKLNFKVEKSKEIAVPIFCEINDNALLLSFIRGIFITP